MATTATKPIYSWIPMGQTIEIRSELQGEWCIAVINSRGSTEAGIPSRKDRAIAEMITKALNSHIPLVCALQDCIVCLQMDSDMEEDFGREINKARAVLAAAR
jgi:hypothetical protein